MPVAAKVVETMRETITQGVMLLRTKVFSERVLS